MASPSWIRGKLLGAGAFGSVHLAIHREDGAVFAAKSVAVDANAEVALRAIEHEITVLQGLDSRYVVRCFGSDWTEESGHLMRNAFLEYMPAGCLTDFVKQFAKGGALDEHLLRTYTRSVVEAIDYLHGQGIVHCDIKGQNILVGNGSVKLTDFGSAKLVTETEEGEDEAMNCKVNGTPLWMAPEVVNQVVQGPASDIWSLGCTVVEMATGCAPWSNLAGMSNQFVALYHIGCTDELPAVPDWLSPEAHDFLSHCFERDPCRRWTSSQLLQHPFLTTQFVEPPACPSAPASPKSMIQFPVVDCDSDSDSSDCFVNSLPTLAAPSLSKRQLVVPELASACHDHVKELNSWSSPDSAGPWIVVRSPPGSPKSSLPPLTDWTMTTPISEGSVLDCECGDSDSTVEMIGEQCTSDAAALPSPRASQAQDETCSSCADVDATCNADDGFVSLIPAAATGGTDSNSCSETGSLGHVSLRRSETCGSVRWLPGLEKFKAASFGFAAWGANVQENLSRTSTENLNEKSVLVSQCCNPRILLYWWHCHNLGRLASVDIEEYRNSCKIWDRLSDQCAMQQLPAGDEYTFSPILQKPSFLVRLCV